MIAPFIVLASGPLPQLDADALLADVERAFRAHGWDLVVDNDQFLERFRSSAPACVADPPGEGVSYEVGVHVIEPGAASMMGPGCQSEGMWYRPMGKAARKVGADTRIGVLLQFEEAEPSVCLRVAWVAFVPTRGRTSEVMWARRATDAECEAMAARPAADQVMDVLYRAITAPEVPINEASDPLEDIRGLLPKP